jgi:hypothetical protein
MNSLFGYTAVLYCQKLLKLEVCIRNLWWKMHNHTEVRGSGDVSIIPHQVTNLVWPSTESSISWKAIGSPDNQSLNRPIPEAFSRFSRDLNELRDDAMSCANIFHLFRPTVIDIISWNSHVRPRANCVDQ